MYFTWSVAATLASFGGAVAFFPALRLGRASRLVAFLTLGSLVALAPWLLPPEARIARLLVCTLSITLIVKMWDVHVGATQGRKPSRREYLTFLVNIFSLVLRRQRLERPPSANDNWKDFGRNLTTGLVAAAAFYLLMQLDWTRAPFLLEHVLKATVLFLFGTALLAVGAALARAAGAYTLTPNKRPFSARTPADFWRRYNRCIGEFLREDVFYQVGGRHHPVPGTIAAFVVSGVLHEYMFTVALGRVEGFQFAFFLVQGLGVVATASVRPVGALGIVGTWLFNACSSIFFFASGQSLIGLYASGLPAWLWGT